MCDIKLNSDAVSRLREFIEVEARSGSMEPSLITAEYVFRMWGGQCRWRRLRLHWRLCEVSKFILSFS